MALAAVNITVGQSLGDGRYSSVTKGGSIPNFASVTADVATLVADGASPTQAHVTTLNTDYTALAGAINGDVTIIWNGAVVTKRNQLRAALQHAIKAIEGGYGGLSE